MKSSICVEYTIPCDIPATLIESWAQLALEKLAKPSTLYLKIVDEDEIQALNSTYRGQDKPTNVLSFPCLLPPGIRKNLLGDIALCAPIIEKEARAQHKTSHAHWAHMIIHGVLHLLGYDHEVEQDAQTMENLEITLLNDLGFPNPY